MAPAAVGELLEEMLRAIYRGCEHTEARRLAFHLVGTAWHTERPGTSQPMHEMEELLSHIGAISEHDGKPSVSDAKTWLRTYGPRGSALASRVGRKSKTRNGMAHPDVTLMAEIDQLVGPKLQEVKTLHDPLQSMDPWAGSKFPVTQPWKPTSASVWSTFQRGAHHKEEIECTSGGTSCGEDINIDEKKDNNKDDKNGPDDTSSAEQALGNMNSKDEESSSDVYGCAVVGPRATDLAVGQSSLLGEWVACPLGHPLVFSHDSAGHRCDACYDLVPLGFRCKSCGFDLCGRCKLVGSALRDPEASDGDSAGVLSGTSDSAVGD
jgi:hypothetical protein